MDDSFDAFLSDYRMPRRFAAVLFGVSARTVRRWRRRGRLPRHAQNMVDVMRDGRAPFGRGAHRGPYHVEYRWRDRLFGPDWKAWCSPEEATERAARMKAAQQQEAALREGARLRRRNSMRQYWRRRKA